MNMHDFLFGAFDPAGTVTVDKLPGALWVQALSAAVLGAHTWALVLPQVIEGTVTVLVLYRAVRRLAGPSAGLLAAGILAISPATVALNRGNISDTLMILLLVLAADATVTAVLTGRLRSVLLAGVWVGLAFQAKMIEAWLVLPADRSLLPDRRTERLAATGAPGGRDGPRDRGRVAELDDGGHAGAGLRSGRMSTAATNDSVFHQVFVYNGLGRVDQATPDQLLNHVDRARACPPRRHRAGTGC